MIRVHKPATPPEILASRGRDETERNRDAYERAPAAYEQGVAQFSFHDDIYGHPSVKEALKSAQYDKCCFCEAKISHISYGDVEHFRPKAGYRQHPRDPLGRPGYYWLAYDWSNLYLACQLCNQRFKRNTFPLIDPGSRCCSHQADLALEAPLFIEPGGEADPEEHIEFLAEQPRARNDSARGRATIEALELQREQLRERRFDRYRMLATLQKVARLMPDEPEGQEANVILEDAVQSDAEYAAMARCLRAR
jgi:uncharacterized protein (TIGR02646 family)